MRRDELYSRPIIAVSSPLVPPPTTSQGFGGSMGSAAVVVVVGGGGKRPLVAVPSPTHSSPYRHRRRAAGGTPFAAHLMRKANCHDCEHLSTTTHWKLRFVTILHRIWQESHPVLAQDLAM